MEPYLCLPIDVVREFDPQVSQDEIEGPFSNEAEARASIIGNEDYNQILYQIESVESTLENRYGKVYKTRKARDVTPKDYVNRTKSFAFPRIFVDVPHRNIRTVDKVEVRTGGDSDDWDTIDSDNYTVDEQAGTMIIQRHRFLSNLYDHPGNSIRLTYDYGTPGFSEDTGGQTTITSSTGTGTGTWDLNDATNLPEYEQTFQIDGEYVTGSVDRDNDELDVTNRGWRGTTDQDHSSGEKVHFAPMDARQACAAKVAIWLANSAIKTDEIAGESMSQSQRMEQWRSMWDSFTSEGEWHSL